MASSGRVSRRSQAGPASPGKRRTKKAASVMVKYRGGAESQLTACLRASIIASGPRSDRPGNAAVLAHAPEVHRHQDDGDHRDSDAVQDVEAQQGARPHEAAGK